MEKAEIKNEILSKIKIELDTLFYMPGEIIKGTIIINPKYRMRIQDKIFHLTLKIMQYEFWEYINIEREDY